MLRYNQDNHNIYLASLLFSTFNNIYHTNAALTSPFIHCESGPREELSLKDLFGLEADAGRDMLSSLTSTVTRPGMAESSRPLKLELLMELRKVLSLVAPSLPAQGIDMGVRI